MRAWRALLAAKHPGVTWVIPGDSDAKHGAPERAKATVGDEPAEPVHKRPFPQRCPVNVVGYVRVSTEEQVGSGAGIDAQRCAIIAECDRRGWALTRIEVDAASGRSLTGRPGLTRALESVECEMAEALIVAKLDRLSRSLLDFAELMARAQRGGWSLVALDLGVDTTTPQGEMMANVLAVFAQFERRLIGQRTREALAVRRSQGVRLGRPPVISPDTRRHIIELRQGGRSLRQIARVLNDARIPTPHGGTTWHASTIGRVVKDGCG